MKDALASSRSIDRDVNPDNGGLKWSLSLQRWSCRIHGRFSVHREEMQNAPDRASLSGDALVRKIGGIGIDRSGQLPVGISIRARDFNHAA